MKKDKFNHLLLERFPLIKNLDEYKQNVFDLDTPAHSFYEQVFVPYIIIAIKNNDVESINKCLGFTEELIKSDDDMANELAMNSILMPLYENKNIDLGSLPLQEVSKKYYKLWLK